MQSIAANFAVFTVLRLEKAPKPQNSCPHLDYVLSAAQLSFGCPVRTLKLAVLCDI